MTHANDEWWRDPARRHEWMMELAAREVAAKKALAHLEEAARLLNEVGRYTGVDAHGTNAIWNRNIEHVANATNRLRSDMTHIVESEKSEEQIATLIGNLAAFGRPK